MLFKTEGIVLHVVRYGETSVIVRIFTELFGIQSYLVNGVRRSGGKNARANILQPAHMLELVVYHRDQKNLQRISEFKLAYLYQELYLQVAKNAVALFVVELLYRCLTEPEPHPDLYDFSRAALLWMDQQPAADLAVFPLYFTLHTAALLGFRISGRFTAQAPYLDLAEGEFSGRAEGTYVLSAEHSRYTSQVLDVDSLAGLPLVQIPAAIRADLLRHCLLFLKLHVPGFYDLRSPDILRDVFH